jgi:hypothetical protein
MVHIQCDRKQEVKIKKIYNDVQLFLRPGQNKAWDSSRFNSRTVACHYVHKLPSFKIKYLIRNVDIH